jgi:hypothetical protein
MAAGSDSARWPAASSSGEYRVEYWSPAAAGVSYLVLVLPAFFFPGWPFYRWAGFWLVRGFNAFSPLKPSSLLSGTGRWFFGCDRIAPPLVSKKKGTSSVLYGFPCFPPRARLDICC